MYTIWLSPTAKMTSPASAPLMYFSSLKDRAAFRAAAGNAMLVKLDLHLHDSLGDVGAPFAIAGNCQVLPVHGPPFPGLDKFCRVDIAARRDDLRQEFGHFPHPRDGLVV